MIVRKSRPEDAQRINELFAVCFETPYASCPIDPEHDDCIHWVAADDDGEIMSCFTIPSYRVFFDGSDCAMAGIGGVTTLPQYRRRGGIRGCFASALPELYRDGYEFSYLYPFSTAFYRKFGYECCVQKFGWEVELSRLAPPKTEGFFRMAEKHRPMTEAIRAVDRSWERHFNMMVQHQAEDYRWTEEADPAVKQEFTYVWFNGQKEPKAYTTFKVLPEGTVRNLVCSRFCFVGREGFAGLMQLFKSLSADHAYAKFQTPALPSLQYLLPEWNQGCVRWNLLHNGGMVRVVNVQKVLEKAAYRGSGRVVLEIRDHQIPENCGHFCITFAQGRALSVKRCEEESDVSLSISTFSALIAGVWDLADARHTFPELQIRDPQASLEQVFYRKPMMIVDYF